MSETVFTSSSEQFNPLTGDVQFNPASWGLNMRDIDAASLNLKTAIYSGNINLTADFYQQIKDLSDLKYSAIGPDGKISSVGIERYMTETGRLLDGTMVGKNPGLYMDHQRLGYWNGLDWQSFIGNNGNFSFSGDVGNYILWNGTTLTIQGNLLLPGGETIAEAISAIPDPTWANLTDRPSVLDLAAVSNPTPVGAGLFISNTHMGYYASGAWKTYMQSNGNFGLSGAGTNYLTWNGTTLSINGSITITGGSGYSNLTDKPDLSVYAQTSSLGSLATKSSVNYATDITGTPTLGTLASLNTIVYNGTYITGLPTLGSLASKNVAAWSTDLSGRPVELTDGRILLGIDASGYIQQIVKGSMLPITGMVTGLNITGTHMGYYNGTSWGAYIQSDGKFYFNGDANNYIQWDGGNLAIKGNIVMTGGSIIWSTVTGAGKPADNATVGATWGVNIGGSNLPANNATVGATWNSNITGQPSDSQILNPDYITSTKITGTTIESCTITGNTVRTAASGARVTMDSAGLKLYDASALRLELWNSKLLFYNSSSAWVGELIGYTSGTFGATINANGSSLSADYVLGNGRDCHFNINGTAYTTKFYGKLKIPVGTNLY